MVAKEPAEKATKKASAKKTAKKAAKKAARSTDPASAGFTAEERAAMKERAKELKAEARREVDREKGERELLDKIAEMPEPDRSMAERIHRVVMASAPGLMPRTWYGMPAYAADGKVVCFFQGAAKFGSRYATFGFNDAANLDEGAMWPTSFAVVELTDVEEARIAALVERAATAR